MSPFSEKNILHQLAYNPKHKSPLSDDEKMNSASSSIDNCEDNFEIYLEIKNKKIIKSKFNGNGCAISSGATEALLKAIESKTIVNAKKIIDEFENFINGKINMIDGELNLFKIVQVHKSRIKCAAAPIKPLKEILENE